MKSRIGFDLNKFRTQFTIDWLRVCKPLCFLNSMIFFAGLFGHWHWMFDNLRNFLIQQIFIAAIFAVIFVFRSYIWACFSGLVFLIGLVSIELPSQEQATINSQSNTYTILSYNVLSSNSEHQSLIDYVDEIDPDFLILIEIDQIWERGIKPLKERYPSIIAKIRQDNFGIIFLAKYPFISSRIDSFSKAGIPSAIAQMSINDKDLTVISTHALAPTSQNNWEDRNQHLLSLKEKLDHHDSALIVAGDLNVSPWSNNGAMLLGSGRYIHIYDALFRPTWPSSLYPFGITLDYILHNKYVEKISYKVGKNLGSDHLPVIMKFKL